MRKIIGFISFFTLFSCASLPQQMPKQNWFASEEEAWLSVIPTEHHEEFRLWYSNESNRKKTTIQNNCSEITNTDFKDQLLILRDRDKQVRTTIPLDMDAMQKVDTENYKVLKPLIMKYGWPEFCQVGLLGVNALWLLVQHATDQDFIHAGMKWLEDLYKEGKIEEQQYAASFDRFMRVNKGLPQKYGTQTVCDKSTNKAVSLPIEDEENIEKLRSSVGLMPLKIYLAVINESDRSCDVE